MIYFFIYVVGVVVLMLTFRYVPKIRDFVIDLSEEFVPKECMEDVNKLIFVTLLWPVYVVIIPVFVGMSLLFVGLGNSCNFIKNFMTRFLFPEKKENKELTYTVIKDGQGGTTFEYGNLPVYAPPSIMPSTEDNKK